MKKKEEKVGKKFNFIKFLVVLLFLYIIIDLIYIVFTYPIKNIYIYGNNVLKDQEIIDSSGIRDYPSFIFTTKNSINNSLLKNELIESVVIEKKWLGEIYITIKENTPLLYNNITKRTVLSNGLETDKILNAPVLNGSISEDIYNKLIEKMKIVKSDVMLKISEIEYSKTEQDNERILLTMTDGNYVYLTLYKFDKINYYNEILPTLEGKHGVLYLDSGNYFDYE
jgi:cell division protein FtsQ